MKACCYRRSWDDIPIVLLAIIMFWTGWGTFFRVVAGWGYVRHARRVRESEWLGSHEVLVVKLSWEGATSDREDTRSCWWNFRRKNRVPGKQEKEHYSLDRHNLAYDLETLPAPVDVQIEQSETQFEGIIGVLILRHVPSASKVSRRCRSRGGRTWIRGWAVSRLCPSFYSTLALHATHSCRIDDYPISSVAISESTYEVH